MRRAYGRPLWVAWAASTALGLILMTSLGRAQDGEAVPPTTENPMEVAREHMERGQSLYNAGRFIESSEEFLRAYEAQPFAAFLFNAGVAYEKVDDPGRAADYFSRYLSADQQAEDRNDIEKRIERLRGLARAREQELAAQNAAQGQTDQAAVAQAQAELEAARARLAELQAQLEAVRGKESFKSLLSVQTTPVDATIVLKDKDGKLLSKGTGSPFAQTLEEGRYFVQVEHPKYKTISTPINIAPGKVYVIITEMSQGQFLGFLRVISSVPGAKVYLDKKEEGAVGKTPYQNAIATGPHHVWIEKPGYQTIEQDVEVGVGDTAEVKAELVRVDYGKIRVLTNRNDAQVYIDGQLVGGVPVEKDVKDGAHVVLVKAPKMKDWEETVTVQRGQVTPVRVRLRPSVSRAGAWVTAGVAAGFLGAAIATGVIGSHIEDDLKKARDAGILATNDDRVLKGKILYISSDISYGLAAMFAGLATYYFLRDPLPDSEGRVLEPRDWTFNPYVAPDRAGGNVHLSF